jgi:hypothetical protein
MGEDDASVARVRDRVARYMSDLAPDGFDVLPNGKFNVRHGSTSIIVGVAPLGAGLTAVDVGALILRRVRPTAALFEYMVVNGERYPLGRMVIDRHEADGLIDIYYHQTMLGDYLDQVEFDLAFSIVAQAANRLDDEMQARFGGQRYADWR